MAQQGNITQQEMDTRVNLAVKLIAKGTIKSDIKKAMQAKFDVSARTVEDYISRARAIMRDDSAGSIEDYRAEAEAWYRSVLLDDRVNVAAKIKARRGMDDLLGLLGPRVVVGIQNTNVHAVAGADDMADALFMEMIDACQSEEDLKIAQRVNERREANKQKRLHSAPTVSAQSA